MCFTYMVVLFSECATAYNFSQNTLQNDIWERYSLINLLYGKLYNNVDKIKLAAPRNILRIFGGELNIHEFRKLNKNYKVYSKITTYDFIYTRG